VPSSPRPIRRLASTRSFAHVHPDERGEFFAETRASLSTKQIGRQTAVKHITGHFDLSVARELRGGN
jgi:hypothetical protein